ncbi:MAG: hypothetical protein ACI9MC_003179, partial [Kiritimatiellia bacterium]
MRWLLMLCLACNGPTDPAPTDEPALGEL